MATEGPARDAAGSTSRALRLRRASRRDLDSVAGWIRNERDCRFWTATLLTYPFDRATLADDIGLAEHSSWVVVAGDEPLAFGQIVAKAEKRFHLVRLIVAPDERRRGIGRILTRGLVDRALAADARTVSLNVDPVNRAAQALYRSLGFEPAELPDDEPRRESPLVYMEWRCENSSAP